VTPVRVGFVGTGFIARLVDALYRSAAADGTPITP